MGEKKREVGYTGTLDREQTLATLRELAASVRAGSVRVEQGEEHITLSPAATVTLSVEAREKKGHRRVRLALRWDEEN